MGRLERAIDSTQDPLGQFAFELRRLRAGAGRPTYRALARTTKYATSTLSVAAGGRQLPSLAVTLAYVKACGGDPVEWEARWRAVADRRATTISVASGGPMPYRGLPGYQPHDKDWFYGRDRAVGRVLGAVAARRLLAVTGPGGHGVSSVLRAGVMPTIARRGLSGRRGWPVLFLTPGAAPLCRLAAYLGPMVGIPAANLWPGDGGSGWLRAAASRLLMRRTEDTGLLLIVDQFEEIWTRCVDAARRAEFISVLTAAVHDPSSRTRIVLGVRADYAPRCAEFPAFAASLGAPVRIPPMGAAELRESIVRSAHRAELRVERQLVDTVVTRVAAEPGVLPLAAHALHEAWRRRRGAAITMAGYRDAGGIDAAVALTAETEYAGLDETQRQIVEGLFQRMLRVGDTGRPVSIRLELSAAEAAGPTAAAALGKLARAGLLTVGQDEVGVAHEALGLAWPRLRGWISEARRQLPRSGELGTCSGHRA